MPTQSLVLRSEIGRRLTINEMDGNFIYLEALAQEGGGGVISSTVSAPQYYIPVGSGEGLTSSENFTYDYDRRNLLTGSNSTINIDSCQSAIVAGWGNSICDNEGGVILGGVGNSLCLNSDNSAVVVLRFHQL